jgi:hypothetical protein
MGLDIRRTSTYHIFSFLFSILITSIISSRFFNSNLKAKRILPKYGTANRILEYTLVIKNLKNKKELSILYKDRFKDSLPSIFEFINIKEPDEEKRNLWDRKLLYYRWLWILKKKKSVSNKEIELPKILPNEEVRIKMTLLPLKRGLLNFDLSIFSKPDIFSMFNSVKYIPNKDELLILPKRYLIKAPNLDSQKVNQNDNTEILSITGKGDEFFALRDYRNGDSIKDIHWKSWAKKGKPIVKEYQQRNYLKTAIILDSDSDNSDVFETAISIAASYIAPLNNKDSDIDNVIIGNYFLKIKNNQDNILTYLAKLEIKPDGLNLNQIKSELDKITGAIIIINNLKNEKIAILNYLKKMNVNIFIVLIINTTLNTKDKEIIDLYDINTIDINKLQKDLTKLR